MHSSKTTKRALLGSFTSLLLCFAMLIGSTFAWFTDTASTSVNTIQAGKLKVDIEMWDGQNWVSADGATLDFVKATDGADEDILWEPGASYDLPKLRIVNKENLALKYKVAITAAQGAQNNKLAEVLDVTVKVGNDILQGVGTLKDVLAQNMDTYIVNNVLEKNQNSGEIAISMKMQQGAGNEYQGLSVGKIAITVYATQATVEYDSNGNQYDADADFPMVWDGISVETNLPNTKTDEGWTNNEYHITTAAQLVGLMNQSLNCESGETHVYRNKTLILDKDIDLGGATIVGFGSYGATFGGTFDGNGHTISNFKIDHTDAAYKSKVTSGDNAFYAGLFNQVQGTVKDLTVKNATVTGERMVGVIASNAEPGQVLNCKVYDSIIVGEKKVGSVVGYTANGIVKDCYAENCAVYCADTGTEQAGEVVGFINTVDSGCTDRTSNNTHSNVTVVRGVTPTLVSTAAELATALDNSGNAPSYDRNVILTSDLDMSSWTSVNGSTNFPHFTITGNGHTLKNLSEPLFDNLPASGFTVKDVNFDSANISTTGSHYAGVIVGQLNCNSGGDYAIENCNITNSTIKSEDYAGGFIGFVASGATTLKIANCSVKDTSVEGGGSSGAFIGHNYANATISNCKILGNSSVKCTEDRNGSAAKAGYFVGTVCVGTTEFTNCSVDSTVTLTNINAQAVLDSYVGRLADGGTATKN